jgi:hypothetical protein
MEGMTPAAPASATPPDDREEGAGGKPKSLVLRVVAIGVGASLILLGIVGLFLPVLQGWLMIVAGLAVLSPYSRRARRIMSWLKEKLHDLGARRRAGAPRDAGDGDPGRGSP